ncbi:RusA family crossover junction endodeoxyribonuclease [Metabacillus fastidiosus]|uniref:RusA family crossover junction endodeoxyribonuclease n=1 Tax=Metabacillus fastidiosus TaxID=1458 RepID=UPI000AB4EBD4|nr:RusA family crossover junction endodeoxyribonuclease [Metabacillus fastidiosus]MED4461832.1 RusA family crossover junction endodeoxyribonuclease [Metabacillus fastidiosus]
MLKLTIPVEPMGAVRMTSRGKYIKPNAQRYLAYKDQIKWIVKQQLKGRNLFAGALEVDILFTMPIPKSWSNKCEEAANG